MIGLDLPGQRVRLDHAPDGESVSEWLRLVTTTPNFGGVRWWVVCPGCDKRRVTLYLPRGAVRFRCRVCHGLAYRSSQTHDRRVNDYRRMLDYACHLKYLARALGNIEGDSTQAALAYRALRLGPLNKPRSLLWMVEERMGT